MKESYNIVANENCNSSCGDLIQRVKESAYQKWDYILKQLTDVDDCQVDTRMKNKGTSCPNCGGNDRYSYKNNDDGSWGCRHCGGGDGFDLLKRINGWTFIEAVKEIDELLLVNTGSKRSTTHSSSSTAQSATKMSRAKKNEYDQVRVLEHQYHKKADYALNLWNKSPQADPNHPFLTSHHLPPFDLRQTQHPVYGWCLLVPLYNDQGKLMNLEQINPDGQKRPIKGGKKKAVFTSLVSKHGPSTLLKVGQQVQQFILVAPVRHV